MVGKEPKDIRVAFVPTAATNEGERKYVEGSRKELIDLGILKGNIQDVHAGDRIAPEWLQSFDVLYVCGGNTFHLLAEVRRNNFGEAAREFIGSGKLYFGVSAGSILVTPNIGIAGVGPADENLPGITDLAGLGIADFEVSPHTPELVSYQDTEEYARENKRKVYAVSDKTAIKLVDRKVEIVGEENWKLFDYSE